MSYQIDSSEVKAETLTYQQFIIRCMDRIHTIAPMKAGSRDWRDWQALETSIMFLSAMVSPYYEWYGKEDNFKEKVEEINKKLNEMKQDNLLYCKDYSYIGLLAEWTKLIAERLGIVSVLPALKITHRFPELPNDIIEVENNDP